MTYFSLKKQVQEKLENHPETRDNDNALIAYLLLDMDFLNLNKITAREFLDKLKDGDYGSIESIRRCRQALQEKNENLRGKLWNKRHGFKEKVKDQLEFEF